MAVHNYSNTASQATLDSPLNSSATSFAVSSYTGYPSAPFWILVDRDTSSSELMEVTGVAGSTLTVSRGQGGTASTSHSAGATVEHVIPAAVPQAAEQHIEATANVHGVVGALLGADSAGTITNKTFQGAFVHSYSSGTPAAPEAGFVVNADNSIARDGFVFDGDGANTDRRGFLLTQDGAERVEVFNDGTVRVTPSGSAVRPGIESTTSVRAADLDITDDAVVGGDLQVAGTTTTTNLSTGNLTTSGAVSFGSSVSASSFTASGVVTSASSAVSGTATVGTVNATNATATTRLTAPTAQSGTTPGSIAVTNSGLTYYRNGSWRGTRSIQFSNAFSSSVPTCHSGNTIVTIGEVNVPDPGWPYHLWAQGSAEALFTAARSDLQLRVGSFAGAVFASARPDDRGDTWGGQLITPWGRAGGSGPLTGAATVWLGFSYVSGGSTQPSTSFQVVNIILYPAP